ncbi:hypothetical protein [Methylobacterium haplocladii]|uniref:hypothetical protein n=1 Tax=Methylobacterium haplocladii TaxID=1176176 RepID=UPI0011BF11EB|nr:hypothetical protein [Methylobacterium haplocladii]GLS61119.1 hypothetical protein GCM10007887_38130 [Methylobacterium haplocladii]
MFYLSIAGLGITTGFALRWPGLVVVISIFAVAFGVAAAIQREPLPGTLFRAGATFVILNLTFFVGSLIRAVLPSILSRLR